MEASTPKFYQTPSRRLRGGLSETREARVLKKWSFVFLLKLVHASSVYNACVHVCSALEGTEEGV